MLSQRNFGQGANPNPQPDPNRHRPSGNPNSHGDSHPCPNAYTHPCHGDAGPRDQHAHPAYQHGRAHHGHVL